MRRRGRSREMAWTSLLQLVFLDHDYAASQTTSFVVPTDFSRLFFVWNSGHNLHAQNRTGTAFQISGDSKNATGDWGPFGGLSWPELRDCRSRRGTPRHKPPEFRGFFAQTGDRSNCATAWLG
jgi:hypothetical protein